MRFKQLLQAFAAALLLAACGLVASAQVAQVTGKVTLKQADGTVVPVVGAQVDIYRTDIKWEDHIKTNKKGEFMHAGVPFVGVYTIAVSAPGAKPTFVSGIRVSQQPEQNFELQPGDGSRLTLDQIKAAGAKGASSGAGAGAAPAESKEAKAAREELEKKNAEIEKKNAEITKSNDIVSRTFKAGNDALFATPPRYDEAIAAYKEGLAARPDEPALLTNLSDALRRRGVERFNAAIKATDNDAKTQGLDAAKKDWTEAADAATKAVTIIKATPPADAASQSGYAQNKIAAISTRALAMRLVATKVDQSKAAETLAAYQEYMEVVTDPAKKAAIRGEALQTVFDAGANDLAIAEAQKIIATDPDNPDANRVLGLALYSSGDKAKYQEAANYLQHYVDKAPDSDPLKESTKAALDYLKTSENIKTQPTTRGSSGRKRP
jgi:hypothetical protein